MTDYVRRYLPGLVADPYAETTCLFTNTPTEDFIVDACERVLLISACSGHGAKSAPLLGEVVAAVLEVADRNDLSAFEHDPPDEANKELA
jgi:sarcosine oxidase